MVPMATPLSGAASSEHLILIPCNEGEVFRMIPLAHL